MAFFKVEHGEPVVVTLSSGTEIDGLFSGAGPEGVLLDTGDPPLLVTGLSFIDMDSVERVTYKDLDQLMFSRNMSFTRCDMRPEEITLAATLRLLYQAQVVCSIRTTELYYGQVCAIERDCVVTQWLNPSGLRVGFREELLENILAVQWGHWMHVQLTRSLSNES